MENSVLRTRNVLRMLLFLLSLSLFIGCAASRKGQTPVGEAENDSGIQWMKITVGETKRNYLMFVPSAYDGKSPVPLVFDFHGTGSTPDRETAYSDFINIAEKKGFILVSPEGEYLNKGRPSWNTTMDKEGVDDIGFIREILGTMPQKFNIDEKRIYAAGMSGGARMSSRVACELSDRVAAIAPVAGIQYPDDCTPSRPIPVITFHGKKDWVNHYVHNTKSPHYWKKSVETSIDGWVKENGCEGAAVSEQISDVVTKVTWDKCDGESEVIFYRIENGGHTWPGSPIVLTAGWAGKTNKDIVASDLIWEFFMKHPLP